MQRITIHDTSIVTNQSACTLLLLEMLTGKHESIVNLCPCDQYYTLKCLLLLDMHTGKHESTVNLCSYNQYCTGQLLLLLLLLDMHTGKRESIIATSVPV